LTASTSSDCLLSARTNSISEYSVLSSGCLSGGRAPAAIVAPPASNPEPAADPAHRRAARYAWALLLAGIYEVFPLVCPDCGGAMRIIAFVTDGPTVRGILGHLG
jgi:hypothetical protein